ncbi:hypothetical protein [Aurantiacibacter hainanensis]|uniref:hypothetical protein n=1 Tax=Aurantiacibacter hainanensis TaxID=3076114 RepID=UPI0030C6A88E
MENRTDIPLGEKFAATIEWWRDAGVDCQFSDEIVPLLSEDELPSPARPAAPQAAQVAEAEKPPEPRIKASDLPDTLAEFRTWWVGPDNPFGASHAASLAPIGKEDAPIMVLTTMPETDDRDSLLSGPQGRLAGNILRAIGIDADTAYFSSALPMHTTLPDWNGLIGEGLGTVIAHHISLARARRLLVFGSRIPALLGHDPAEPPESFDRHGDVPALATFSPDRLLDHARQRARLWKRLCEWTSAQ